MEIILLYIFISAIIILCSIAVWLLKNEDDIISFKLMAMVGLITLTATLSAMITKDHTKTSIYRELVKKGYAYYGNDSTGAPIYIMPVDIKQKEAK